MCIVCVLYDKEKITSDEADKALVELIDTDNALAKDEQHIWEVLEKIGKL